MRKILYSTALKRSVRYLGPAFLIPIILISAVDLQRDLKKIDIWLLRLAKNVPLLLAEDFHDRAVDADSIDYTEELRNRKQFSKYAEYHQITWVYTLIKKEGKLFITAPTVTEEEARERESWYFFEYKNAHKDFHASLADGQTRYINYNDQWGRFRTIILPLQSPGGKSYAACIDISIPNYIKMLIQTAGFDSLLLFISFSVTILYISLLTVSGSSKSNPSRHILMSRKELQNIIDLQTEHLYQLTEKEKTNNLQLTNALYAGQMGLYAFNIATGRLHHAFNNTLPDTLGYKHGQYQLHLDWLLENLVDPEYALPLESLWRDILSGEKSQASMDLRLKDNQGKWQWHRIHLTLQKGVSRREDKLLVLTQGIQDVKMRERILLRQVQTDDLTGLHNRSYWEEYIRALQSRNRRSDLPLVVCFIDINGLKKVNDNLGHNAGDKLLTDFAGILNRTIRGADIAVRLGGDEFLLVCPQTDEGEFKGLWHRIEKNTKRFNESMDRDYTLSFSHGICVITDLSDDNILNLHLEEADKKMYEEKRAMKMTGLHILRSC